MPRKKPDTDRPAQAYYYAGGTKVYLTPADDLVALDSESLQQAGIGEGSDGAVRSLSSKVKLVDRARVGTSAGHGGRALVDRYPVFRSHGVVMVVLPEIRVEESRPHQKKRLEDWLRVHAAGAVIERKSDDQLVLTPASGDGSDALDLANALAEQVEPEMAQVRFLRVTPAPGEQAKARPGSR
ncbi:hypothetical protein R5W24_003907 [Gemmata sp. JC717]|uniref:hypothetical protein n=1 Tax=Gemmata algarum TaxID=2975278 RepID=UPI0021BAF911|nr:hypothetical protein [Gemmata algarum]MDY3554778.1 hypothetical protein [Gemmata algarum]